MSENERIAKAEARIDALEKGHDHLTERHEKAVEILFQENKDIRKDRYKVLFGIVMLFVATVVEFVYSRATQ